MIKQILYSLLVVALFFSPSYANKTKKTTSTNLNKIVAIVNSDIITQNELELRMAILQRILPADSLTTSSTIRQQALDNLIDNSLQLQLAQRSGIQVSDADLESIIANIAYKNQVTIATMKKTLQTQEGISFAEYREQLREQILINKVVQQFLGKDITINDQEVQKILKNPPKQPGTTTKYHVVDILVALPEDATPKQLQAVKDLAKQMAQQLKQKTDIEKLIPKNSEYQISNNDLGWRTSSELPELFAKEITKMQVNQIIGPLTAPNGLHFLQLLGKQENTMKFTKEQAQEFLWQQKLSDRIKPWLQKLRASAYIKIF